jgi:hypothetical protein
MNADTRELTTAPVQAPADLSHEQAGHNIENVIIKGDLASLTPEQRARYYVAVCKSVGLNPLTQPFDYIKLNGRLQLYAKRDAADQLRKLHGINLQILSQDIDGDLLRVHVRAKDNNGREDEDLGVVQLPPNGEARANAILKAITKAKRRVTLSICGLGLLDETEVTDIPRSTKRAWTGDTDDQPAETITHAQAEELAELIAATDMRTPEFRLLSGAERISDVLACDYLRIKDALLQKRKARKQATAK